MSRSDVPDAPLGVFDSGVGGLTVVRAIRQALPNESIVYLGDTARVPYGTKGRATIVRYAQACANYLAKRGVKTIVIACNTAASALEPNSLKSLSIPILDVIAPGAEAATKATRSARIGVLATAATITSGAYTRAIEKRLQHAHVHGEAAPLLVPLAEEGWTEGDVPELAVRRYITPFAKSEIDTLVLGCTHYPLLRATIAREVARSLGPHVTLVDSAESTAESLRRFLRDRSLTRCATEPAQIELLTTDSPRLELIRRFLDGEPSHAECIDL